MKYFIRTPVVVRMLRRDIIWRIGKTPGNIYLTFDDGPDETVTPLVLDILNERDAKATFFCLGRNAARHPELVDRIRLEGHTLGNHSFDHLDGRRIDARTFLSNVMRAHEIIRSPLFRPPYGWISSRQIRLLGTSFHIIGWTVLPGDFDSRVSRELCLKRLYRHTRGGDIVVLHDREAYKEKLLFLLPLFLDHFITQGYRFMALERDTSGEIPKFAMDIKQP
ncbi:MAG: polysaccharide deacetylase family protein [Bacteroidales bacterium]|nr:polysaccharide deacetylase family protein [Bacteroidales bacterium]